MCNLKHTCMFTNTHSLKQAANFIPRPHFHSWRRYSDVLLCAVSKDCKRMYLKEFPKKPGVLQMKHIGMYSKHKKPAASSLPGCPDF